MEANDLVIRKRERFVDITPQAYTDLSKCKHRGIRERTLEKCEAMKERQPWEKNTPDLQTHTTGDGVEIRLQIIGPNVDILGFVIPERWKK